MNDEWLVAVHAHEPVTVIVNVPPQPVATSTLVVDKAELQVCADAGAASANTSTAEPAMRHHSFFTMQPSTADW